MDKILINNLDFEKTASIDRDLVFSDKDFEIIKNIIHQEAGIVLKNEKKTMVYSRLGKRVRELNFKSFQEYLSYLNNSKNEIEFLFNALTTNLTKFFREEHHFKHLQDVVIPMIVKNQPHDRKIRIWSSACSSGEEPYSIAMTLLSSQDITNWDTKILATDIDTNMLDRAKKGIYQKAQGISNDYYEKYTSVIDDGFIVKDNVKKLITFNRLNLLDTWPMKGAFDVIFCRNVVIYFDKETQKIIFEKMASIMKKDSFLYIGHSESLYKVTDKFELIGQTIYKKV